MLRDDIEKYTELSGSDGWHTPIGIIDAYLDGYEKGLESRETIRGEWISDESDNSVTCNRCGCQIYPNDILNGEANFCPNCGYQNRIRR